MIREETYDDTSDAQEVPDALPSRRRALPANRRARPSNATATACAADLSLYVRDDVLENIGQIVPRVDVLQLCRVNERRENGPCLGAAFTAGGQVVLLSQAYRLDAALDRIVVYFNASVIDEARQAVPMVEGVADGFAETGLLRDFQ